MATRERRARRFQVEALETRWTPGGQPGGVLGDALTRPTGKEVPPVQVAPVADGAKPGVASGANAGVASVAHGSKPGVASGSNAGVASAAHGSKPGIASGSNAGVAPVAHGSNTVRAGEEGN